MSNVEVREYTVTNDRSTFGRSTIDIRCPFCQSITTAFVWSLAGSGKRCENRSCRALFNGRGRAAGKTPDHENGSQS